MTSGYGNGNGFHRGFHGSARIFNNKYLGELLSLKREQFPQVFLLQLFTRAFP